MARNRQRVTRDRGRWKRAKTLLTAVHAVASVLTAVAGVVVLIRAGLSREISEPMAYRYSVGYGLVVVSMLNLDTTRPFLGRLSAIRHSANLGALLLAALYLALVPGAPAYAAIIVVFFAAVSGLARAALDCTGRL